MRDSHIGKISLSRTSLNATLMGQEWDKANRNVGVKLRGSCETCMESRVLTARMLVRMHARAWRMSTMAFAFSATHSKLEAGHTHRKQAE